MVEKSNPKVTRRNFMRQLSGVVGISVVLSGVPRTVMAEESCSCTCSCSSCNCTCGCSCSCSGSCQNCNCQCEGMYVSATLNSDQSEAISEAVQQAVASGANGAGHCLDANTGSVVASSSVSMGVSQGTSNTRSAYKPSIYDWYGY